MVRISLVIKPAVKIVSVFVCPLVSRCCKRFYWHVQWKGNLIVITRHFNISFFSPRRYCVTFLWTISPSSVQFERITTGSVPDFLVRGPQSGAGVRCVDKSCKWGWSWRKHHQKVYNKGQWTFWYENFAFFFFLCLFRQCSHALRVLELIPTFLFFSVSLICGSHPILSLFLLGLILVSVILGLTFVICTVGLW